MCAPVVDEICSRLGDVVYGTDMNSIEERVVALLKEKGAKDSDCRIPHGGYIPKRLTGYPPARPRFSSAE